MVGNSSNKVSKEKHLKNDPSYVRTKYLPVFFCLLNLTFAVREKQIKLEDIEKDNLASEGRPQQPLGPLKEQLQLPQQYIAPPQQYQQFDLPYLTDNQLSAQDSNAFQQYYNPQLLYLQQYPAASTNIQSVIDPKGGVQYVMYVPSQYLQGAKAEQTQTKAPKFELKFEPKSLLDSYVPSLLQYEYFKQQQQQARGNAIQQPLKTAQPAIGKDRGGRSMPKNATTVSNSSIKLVEGVKNGLSFTAAATEYGIPKSTIIYKDSGHRESFGPPPVLNVEEENNLTRQIYEKDTNETGEETLKLLLRTYTYCISTKYQHGQSMLRAKGKTSKEDYFAYNKSQKTKEGNE
ncbi:hypothetical protein ILUMI_08960 [Ignelater luminosus]|uniref:HTH psq-type domain-containing protein n=1 Tax=Ignelater luminosus TaxID=2038154 RepID=A0A8K0D0Q5_IGNLU|nr:hypothetical protein ILUMI_08960 [Ignelater luminosus]